MKRFLTLMIATLVLATPVTATNLTAMSDDERAAFRAEVRAYLLENPGVIMEAVAALEAAQANAQIENDKTLIQVNAADIFDDGFSWVGGNPDGDITLVEFMDYRCGYCRRAHGEVAKLLESDGNIRFVVKEFPILGEESMLASRFAIAAKNVVGDAEYKLLNDALMYYTGEINETALRRLSDTMGLDAEVIMAEMNSDQVTKEIALTRALAQRLQINGTPTFVLEDQMLRGYVPLEQMQSAVEDVRTR